MNHGFVLNDGTERIRRSYVPIEAVIVRDDPRYRRNPSTIETHTADFGQDALRHRPVTPPPALLRHGHDDEEETMEDANKTEHADAATRPHPATRTSSSTGGGPSSSSSKKPSSAGTHSFMSATENSRRRRGEEVEVQHREAKVSAPRPFLKAQQRQKPAAGEHEQHPADVSVDSTSRTRTRIVSVSPPLSQQQRRKLSHHSDPSVTHQQGLVQDTLVSALTSPPKPKEGSRRGSVANGGSSPKPSTSSHSIEKQSRHAVEERTEKRQVSKQQTNVLSGEDNFPSSRTTTLERDAVSLSPLYEPIDERASLFDFQALESDVTTTSVAEAVASGDAENGDSAPSPLRTTLIADLLPPSHSSSSDASGAVVSSAASAAAAAVVSMRNGENDSTARPLLPHLDFDRHHQQLPPHASGVGPDRQPSHENMPPQSICGKSTEQEDASNSHTPLCRDRETTQSSHRGEADEEEAVSPLTSPPESTASFHTAAAADSSIPDVPSADSFASHPCMIHVPDSDRSSAPQSQAFPKDADDENEDDRRSRVSPQEQHHDDESNDSGNKQWGGAASSSPPNPLVIEPHPPAHVTCRMRSEDRRRDDEEISEVAEVIVVDASVPCDAASFNDLPGPDKKEVSTMLSEMARMGEVDNGSTQEEGGTNLQTHEEPTNSSSSSATTAPLQIPVPTTTSSVHPELALLINEQLLASHALLVQQLRVAHTQIAALGGTMSTTTTTSTTTSSIRSQEPAMTYRAAPFSAYGVPGHHVPEVYVPAPSSVPPHSSQTNPQNADRSMSIPVHPALVRFGGESHEENLVTAGMGGGGGIARSLYNMVTWSWACCQRKPAEPDGGTTRRDPEPTMTSADHPAAAAATAGTSLVVTDTPVTSVADSIGMK